MSAVLAMKKTLHGEHLLIFLLIAVNLAFGITTLANYGESWDEARLYEYGEQSLNAYQALLNPAILVGFGEDDLRYYGPAYFMGMSLLVKAAQSIFPEVLSIDLRHFGTFTCLQLGLLCFYFLICQFTNTFTAFTTTALFASQPLIWGHGFINPKDIPFMTFFAASVYLGIRLVKHFETQNYEVRSLITNPWFYAASMALGLTISIRILGFAAAAIVLFHFAFINVKKVLRLSYPYLGFALLVCLFTWPYLWSAPLTNFLQGIYAMLKFQWVGHVLFNGAYYLSNDLPRIYVPQLLGMQLTESSLLLFTIGIIAVASQRLRTRYRSLFLLLTAWFIFPLLFILINGMNLYDNTRQLLFIIPGMFLASAVGLDVVLERAKSFWVRTLVLLAVITPGVAGIVKFHPYEYTYYNASTTSSVQIFRNYETDYWATSFRQVALFLNENAGQDSQVIVWGPAQIVERYAREDLDVRSFDDLKDEEYAAHPYFLVLTTRYDIDTTFFPETQPIYVVEQNNTVYAVVKYITPQP